LVWFDFFVGWFGFLNWFDLVGLVCLIWFGFVGWFGLVRLLWLVWMVFGSVGLLIGQLTSVLLLPNVLALHQLQFSPVSWWLCWSSSIYKYFSLSLSVQAGIT
jgi:hypothetical protein